MFAADDYAELIYRLFCRPGAEYGPYEPVGEPEVVVPDLLVRVEVCRPGDESERFELSIFFGVNGFAGELWEHEVRGLLRLDALNHPALPKIVGGGFHAADELAFTITERRGQPLGVEGAIQWARSKPLEAFKTFSVLLDALTNLHGARLLHRNLTMGALRAVQMPGDTKVNIQLTRFEMSTLIGNLVRRTTTQDSEHVQKIVRAFYLATPAGMDDVRHLAYMAPETLEFVLNERSGQRRDWESTDLFGMGVLGWEWFCGSIPEVLPETYNAALTTQGPSRAVALARLQGEMRAHLAGRFDLPKPLVALLQALLHPTPSERPSSVQALSQLNQHWEGICQTWEPMDEVPRLVAFMPDQSVETIFQLRKWISHSPDTPAGRDALTAFYTRELRKAELVWSPTGAVGYASDEPDKLEEAKWVLIGEQAVWFCAFLYDEDLISSRRGARHEDTLVIKYLKDRNYAQALENARPRRTVGRVEVVPFYPGQSLTHARKNRPSWEPLTNEVQGTSQRNKDEQEFIRSFDFLLDYQRAELNARKYPFTRTDRAEEPGHAVLTCDHNRDAARRHHNPLLAAYSSNPRRRPRLSDFVEGLSNEKPYIALEVVKGSNRKVPSFARNAVEVHFVERRDADTIVVKSANGQPIPLEGWLRPKEDSGSEPQLGRQTRARILLESQAALIRSLRAPVAYNLGRGRWSADTESPLKGDAPERIADMIALHPFYALQGPPGTGKSTVAAHAIRRFLREEPGARVLVSAQSNYALDSLGSRLIEEMPDMLILRETPESVDDEDKVTNERVLQHTLTKLTQRVTEAIQLKLTWKLHPERLTPAQRAEFERLPADQRPVLPTDMDRPLAEEWLNRLSSNQIELTDRIKSGASIVLATCSMAGVLMDNDKTRSDLFDWVIVEEAAKAWPTEIIIPLVLGSRWTLIGDHRQLGAYREEEVIKFLNDLRTHADKDMRLHFEERYQREKVLHLFGQLFASAPQAREESRQRNQPSPLGVLDLQFRMHPTIAEPVGRAFYPHDPVRLDEDGLPTSFLGTYLPDPSEMSADRAHGVSEPEFLRDAPLVWLDTTGHDDCLEQPYWYNLGEVELVDRLVERMRPAALAVGEPVQDNGGLVILTPYHAQRKQLENRGNLRGRVHTVHSFQGREADHVIVSLVRTTKSGNTVAGNVGHVGQREVANVLLSRARRLLVLVGSFAHLAENGGTSWQIVTNTFRRYGKVVPIKEWMGQ